MQKKISSIQTVLGFDYGEKYIGIATGQTVTQTAVPATCLIYQHKIPWEKIQELMTRYQPDACIVGLPLGEHHRLLSSTPKATQFAWQLETRFSIPVYCVNEHLSTWEARQQLHVTAKQSDFLKLNTHAAVILVRRWLTEHWP